jgi:hypothetical protein
MVEMRFATNLARVTVAFGECSGEPGSVLRLIKMRIPCVPTWFSILFSLFATMIGDQGLGGIGSSS